MQRNLSLIDKHLVLIGGGHTHVGVVKALGEKPLNGLRLTLIGRDVNTPYSGMLPGLIAGHYAFEEIHIDLCPLARFANARFYHDVVVGLDLKEQRILCRDHAPIPYDVLSINIGSTPTIEQVPGAADHVIPVKPIDRFLGRWQGLRDRILTRYKPTRIGVVGGGAGGVEILLAIQYRLQQLLGEQQRSANHLAFHLVTDSTEILPGYNRRARAKFLQILDEREVQVHVNHRVKRVEADMLYCTNGVEIPVDEILWVTQADAADWVAKSGLAVDERGFIQVNDYLQSISHPQVFAAGDIATMIHHPRPKAGVFAVRQAPPLTENLRRALRGEPLAPFIPQREFLTIITTGDQYAVASRDGWAMEGHLIWRWKDWIDRRFMRQYSYLPEVAG